MTEIRFYDDQNKFFIMKELRSNIQTILQKKIEKIKNKVKKSDKKCDKKYFKYLKNSLTLKCFFHAKFKLTLCLRWLSPE